MKLLKIIFSISICMIVLQGAAQNMSTPYSVYGIGDLDHRLYNHNSGMGYTGLALKTTLYSSGNNPASLAGLQRSYFVLDVSGAGKFVTYAGDDITATNSSNRDFTIKKLGLSSKINSFWASGIGFKQLSSVNYSFLSQKSITGSTDTYTISYSGDGGINEYYWNNAFSLGKHFSVGVTSSFVAGGINQTEAIVDASDTTIESKRRDYYANAKFDFGAIYTANLNKKWTLGIGGRFSNASKLPAERTLTVTDNSTEIVSEELIKYTRFSLPLSYGAGISLSSKSGQTFAADYSVQNWSGLNIKGTGWRLVNSQRVSVGAEFANFKQDQWTGNVQKSALQLGAYINNSYLRIQNHQINEYGFTAGMSHTLKNGLMYTVSGEAGVRGTTTDGLIKENFFQLSFNISLRDYLFSKGHKYN